MLTGDCPDGPRVTGEDGRVVELPGSVCPGQRLDVTDETAELVQQTGSG